VTNLSLLCYFFSAFPEPLKLLRTFPCSLPEPLRLLREPCLVPSSAVSMRLSPGWHARLICIAPFTYSAPCGCSALRRPKPHDCKMSSSRGSCGWHAVHCPGSSEQHAWKAGAMERGCCAGHDVLPAGVSWEACLRGDQEQQGTKWAAARGAVLTQNSPSCEERGNAAETVVRTTLTCAWALQSSEWIVDQRRSDA